MHIIARRLVLKAITKGTSGNNLLIADLATKYNMQEMGALDTSLLSWLAQETPRDIELQHDYIVSHRMSYKYMDDPRQSAARQSLQSK